MSERHLLDSCTESRASSHGVAGVAVGMGQRDSYMQSSAGRTLMDDIADETYDQHLLRLQALSTGSSCSTPVGHSGHFS